MKDRGYYPSERGSMANNTDSKPEATLSRTARKRADRIMQIERVAASVFAKRGYESTNFDEIADELDLRGSSLFHYFSSKSELYSRILEHSAAAVVKRLSAVVNAGGRPDEIWEQLIREQVLIQVRDYPESVPLFYKANTSDPELQQRILEIRRQHAAIFEKIAKRWYAETGARTLDIRIRIGITFGALAYLQEWYDPAGKLKVEQLADLMAQELRLSR